MIKPLWIIYLVNTRRRDEFSYGKIIEIHRATLKRKNKFDTRHVSGYICIMILSIRHKGLRLYFEKGDASKLQPQHISKIRLILTRLQSAKAISDMNIPGYGLHQLSGELKGFWAVKIDKNYRIIFQLIAEDVHEVDYLDYH